MNTNTGSMEWYDGITPVWEAGVDARAQFITRTYGHLILAIAAFIGIEVALFQSGAASAIQGFFTGKMWLLAMGGFILAGWLGTKAAHSNTSRGVQYLGLFGLVAAYAVFFCPLLFVAHNYAPGVIESAALISAIGFVGLTAIAFVTRKDFSFMRGILMWGGVIALLLIVGSVIFGFQLGTFFAVAMVALAGGSILYDTSNVLHHYPADRHVAASLELFASVAMLFYYVVYLLLTLRD